MPFDRSQLKVLDEQPWRYTTPPNSDGTGGVKSAPLTGVFVLLSDDLVEYMKATMTAAEKTQVSGWINRYSAAQAAEWHVPIWAGQTSAVYSHPGRDLVEPDGAAARQRQKVLSQVVEGRLMVRIIGRETVTARLRGAAGRQAIEDVGKALYVGGDAIRTEAALSITRGSVSGRNHVASLPGEPPNADTHILDRSIEVHQIEPLRVQVSANAPYAVPLEGGTSRMAARPFMGPAARLKKKEVIEGVRAAVNRALRKGK